MITQNHAYGKQAFVQEAPSQALLGLETRAKCKMQRISCLSAANILCIESRISETPYTRFGVCGSHVGWRECIISCQRRWARALLGLELEQTRSYNGEMSASLET